MEYEAVVALLTNLGVAGVLGWYLFYDATVAKPRSENMLMTRVDQIVDRQLASTERNHANFIAAIKEEREACDLRMSILQDEVRHLRGLSDSVRRNMNGDGTA